MRRSKFVPPVVVYRVKDSGWDGVDLMASGMKSAATFETALGSVWLPSWHTLHDCSNFPSHLFVNVLRSC